MTSVNVNNSNVLIPEGATATVSFSAPMDLIFHSMNVYGYVVDSGGTCKLSTRIYTDSTNPEGSTIGSVKTVETTNTAVHEAVTISPSEEIVVEKGETLYIRVRVNTDDSNSDFYSTKMVINYEEIAIPEAEITGTCFFGSVGGNAQLNQEVQADKVTATFNITCKNCTEATLNLIDSNNEVYTSISDTDLGTGTVIFSGSLLNPINVAKGTKIALKAKILYTDLEGKSGSKEIVNNSGKGQIFFNPDKLGSFTLSVDTSFGKNIDNIFFVEPEEEYSISWTKPNLNANEVLAYTYFVNNSVKAAAGSNEQSIQVLNDITEKQSAECKVKATAAYVVDNVDSTYSNSLTGYTFKIDEKQQYINIDNLELSSGSATLQWEPLKYSISENIQNILVQYNLKYKISEDGKTWDNNLYNIVTNCTNPYIIDDISSITSQYKNQFICFVIESEIFYNDIKIRTITTDITDGLIKYIGEKPSQLTSIIFNNSDLKGKEYISKYIYSDNSYIRETFDLKCITKGTILTINFGELKTGYVNPGVKITWQKDSIKKSKEFISENNSTMTIDFGMDDFFDDNFWNNTNNLLLTITSLGKTTTGVIVSEEQRGYFYKGTEIQVIKAPIMSNNYDNISTTNKNIPVNFDFNNQEPVVDIENNIYEDLKIENLKATHPQEIDIYAYKVYASAYINNNWKTFIPVLDNILSASKGGTYSQQVEQEGWFIPAWRYDIGDGSFNPVENNITNLELNILNPEKNNHLTSLLGSDISNYGEKLNVEYRIKAIDSYGQESNNYFSYNFIYDCRKPAIFEVAPSTNSSSLETRTIAPYGDSIATIPVFNDDKLIVKFYPAINERHYIKNTSQYITFDNKTYLKFTNDNSIIDPNYYSVYKFIKQPSGELKSYLIDLIQPFLNNSSVLKKSENINNESVLYYLYQLNFDLNDKNIDEVVYYQIVPFYEETNETRRTSRIYCYEDNRNKFNISYGNNSAIFWNSRLDIIPKVQITGIERIATTKDEFGFKLPKLKLYITDWGTTHQFVGGDKLEKEDLLPYNRLTELNYSIKFYKEVVDAEGNVFKEYLPELDWNRTYLPDNEHDITYDILAQEYGYSNFEELYNSMDEEYQITYSDYSGSDEVPTPSTGSTVYINLKSPIIDANENSTNFLAKLDINGKVLRVSIDTLNKNEIIEQELELSNYSIYISQNKKTFMIQQGKLGINQPELDEVEESLYIIDKKNTNKDNDSYPNILGLEMSRNFNKINGVAGAFIGFYDDSTMNDGNRILMGSIGLVVDYDDSGKATNYTPHVVYNEFDEEGNLNLTSLNLIPEAGNYIEIEGHRISHAHPETSENVSFLKMAYDNFGHITGSQEATRDDIRNIARITYGTTEPLVDGAQEGDIYIWIQPSE